MSVPLDRYALTTRRLRLRPFVAGDAGPLHAILSNPSVTATTTPGFMPSLSQVQVLIAKCATEWERHHFGQWGVVEKREPGVLVGYCGFKRWQEDKSALELLFGFTPTCWGQGLATEAAVAAVSFWRRHHPSVPLVASAFIGNGASHRVLLKAGLQYAGTITIQDGEEIVYRLAANASSKA